ncbi:dipeptide ABC transporter ATP-binding protein [Nocardia bovistercoris]|uniref:ABC transporter ATP-binding protein n=1 Tax=Nocardia bovistercoris TaxID=2785916 RepID=A0A931IFM0_9NOCA|nr:ABC transporter ATP-binding protein [Nocardia bovistercoris]MBH0779551.1 ABC transporter ATP-binding protein [Nocardia bovistercoris]
MTTLLTASADQTARLGNPVAEIEDLRISVGGAEHRDVVVDGVSLSVRAGETVGLVGESGSGKTMTALGLAGLLPRGAAVDAGRVTLSGTDLDTLTERRRARVRAERIGVVFQNPTASLNPRLTIATQLLEALPRDAGSRGRRRARAADLLGRVGIADVGKTLGAFPHELSGGLNQRVVIAMALARDPALLVADEPTTALDVSVQAQVLDLIDRLKHELGLGVLLVSHDIGVIGDRTDRVHVMSAGTIVESGPTAQVLRAPRHAYTRELLAATPALLRRAGTDAEPSTKYGTEPDHRSDAESNRVREVGAIVRVREVRRAFAVTVPGRLRKQRHIALHGVSLDIPYGAAIGVVGESGSGKTTLARQIVGLDQPDSGVVEYEGAPLGALDKPARRRWRRAVQYVFQDPYGALDPRLTVARSIAEPLELNGVELGGRTVAQRVRELLGEVELPVSCAGRLPRELSGGQLQRVVIARALANDPRVVVADEPVSALDLSVQARILRLLERLRRERGLTLVLISHDLAVVRFLCDHVVVMERGLIVESGATEQIYTAPAHPYTRSLLAAVPGAAIPAYHEETP